MTEEGIQASDATGLGCDCRRPASAHTLGSRNIGVCPPEPGPLASGQPYGSCVRERRRDRAGGEWMYRLLGLRRVKGSEHVSELDVLYRFEFRLHAAHSVLNRLERNPQIRLHEQATEKVAPGTHGPPPVNAAYRTTTVEFLSYRPGLTRSAVACTALVHSWVAGQVPAPTT
jgi:hypothetical protein